MDAINPFLLKSHGHTIESRWGHQPVVRIVTQTFLKVESEESLVTIQALSGCLEHVLVGKVVSRPPESNNEPAPETTEYGFGGGYDDTFDGID